MSIRPRHGRWDESRLTEGQRTFRRGMRAAFWKKVKKGKSCWLFGGNQKDGYGILDFAYPEIRAHRYSWRISHGDIPRGGHVLHKCDVRHCVNPDHLYIGTNADNIGDKVRRGRSKTKPEHIRRGSRHPRTSFTDRDVLLIRDRLRGGERVVALAKEYGVCHQTISNIGTRRSWTHI